MCLLGAPLLVKKDRIQVAMFQREDDQQYPVPQCVFETVLRGLGEPLHVA
jgi:hypothetical protein